MRTNCNIAPDDDFKSMQYLGILYVYDQHLLMYTAAFKSSLLLEAF